MYLMLEEGRPPDVVLVPGEDVGIVVQKVTELLLLAG